MKKVAVLLVFVFILALTSTALAFGGAEGKGWDQTGAEHYSHTVVDELRFDTATGRKAIPGNAFNTPAVENSDVIFNHRGQTLIDPLDSW